MSVGNARSGGTGSGPNCWTAPDGTEYCVLITTDWNGLAGRREPGGEWETFDLSTIPGNPLELPIDTVDSHHRLAMCVDPQGFIHIFGNSHGADVIQLHYVKSNEPNTFSAGFSAAGHLADLTPSSDSSIENSRRGTYDTLVPFSNGVIAWFRSQFDGDTVLGRDSICYVLKPGEDTWLPWDGVGDFLICDTVENNGDPERAYFRSITVHNDTLWVGGVWQWDAVESGETDGPEGQDTRKEPYIIKSEDFSTAIMNGEIPTFTSVSGHVVTMPMLEPESKAVPNCTVPDTLDPSLTGGNLGFDSNDHIHFVEAGYFSGRHHWWDGSAWQYEDGTLFVPNVSLVKVKGYLHHYSTIAGGGRMKVVNLETNEVCYLGRDVPGSINPLPDPIMLQQGILKLAIPEGNLPRTYTFGDGLRLRGSS